MEIQKPIHQFLLLIHTRELLLRNSNAYGTFKKELVQGFDGRRISGRGRLTEKLINKLQNLYGIALRQNVNKTVHEMKVVIGAVLYHSTEFKETENCHLYCP